MIHPTLVQCTFTALQRLHVARHGQLAYNGLQNFKQSFVHDTYHQLLSNRNTSTTEGQIDSGKT